MPTSHGARQRIERSLLLTWTLAPWAVLAWLGGVIAFYRWSGLTLAASLSVGALAAGHGWRRLSRWCQRRHDVEFARALEAVPDPEPWALFIHPAQRIKAAHFSECGRRWGVNARSSGWSPTQRRGGGLDLAGVPVCMALAVHPWWLSL